ncbi:MAG: hypothetical protein ABIJ95_05745 [Pseudomonadota bacterium]
MAQPPPRSTKPATLRQRLMGLVVGLAVGLTVFAAGKAALGLVVAWEEVPLPPGQAFAMGRGLFAFSYLTNPGPFLEPLVLPSAWETLAPGLQGGKPPAPAILVMGTDRREPVPRRFSVLDLLGRDGYLVLNPSLSLSLPGHDTPPQGLVLRVPMGLAPSLALAAGLLAGLLAWWAAGPRTFSRCLLGLGIVLLAMNLAGPFPGLRNPGLEREPRAQFYPADIRLSPGEATELLKRRPRETTDAYLSRATATVNLAMAHYWPDSGVDAYRIRVPLWENWVLYAASFGNGRYRKYEFFDPARTLSRGTGRCGQQALTLANLLRENGVRARILNLPVHTVVTAPGSAGLWILDPDYGVVIPLAPGQAEGHPDRVSPYYREAQAESSRLQEEEMMKALQGVDPARANEILSLAREMRERGLALFLAGAYGGPPGSFQVVEPEEYFGGEKYVFLERWAYQAKWWAPFLLLVPAAVRAARGRKGRAGDKADAGKDGGNGHG